MVLQMLAYSSLNVLIRFLNTSLGIEEKFVSPEVVLVLLVIILSQHFIPIL